MAFGGGGRGRFRDFGGRGGRRGDGGGGDDRGRGGGGDFQFQFGQPLFEGFNTERVERILRGLPRFNRTPAVNRQIGVGRPLLQSALDAGQLNDTQTRFFKRILGLLGGDGGDDEDDVRRCQGQIAQLFPGCCLVGDSEVVLANGSVKRIEEIEVGDKVLGQDGPKEVVGVIPVKLGERTLVGVNGGRPVFTEDHAVRVEDGWAAVNPSMFRDRYPGVAEEIGEVHKLDVGSKIIRPDGSVEVVESLELRPSAHPSVPVYDIEVEGDRSYFAEDYVFHNKTTVEIDGDDPDSPPDGGGERGPPFGDDMGGGMVPDGTLGGNGDFPDGFGAPPNDFLQFLEGLLRDRLQGPFGIPPDVLQANERALRRNADIQRQGALRDLAGVLNTRGQLGGGRQVDLSQDVTQRSEGLLGNQLLDLRTMASQAAMQDRQSAFGEGLNFGDITNRRDLGFGGLGVQREGNLLRDKLGHRNADIREDLGFGELGLQRDMFEFESALTTFLQNLLFGSGRFG